MVDAADDRTTDEDRELLRAIWDCTNDPPRFMNLVFAYYHDADRADRTPRSWMYLHLGQLTGVVGRLLEERDRGNHRPQ